MKTHEESRAEAYAVLLEHWKKLAKEARTCGLIELADMADAQVKEME